MESHVDSPSCASTTSAMPETQSTISLERNWTEEKSESTTLVTNVQLLIDVAEEIEIVVDLVAALEAVADLEAARGTAADAADLTREIDEENAARLEAALDRDHEDEMSDKNESEAAREADLDLAREIDAPNLEMRKTKRNARDLALPKRRPLDPALDLDPARDKHSLE